MTPNERRLILRAHKLLSAMRRLQYSEDPTLPSKRHIQAVVAYKAELVRWQTVIADIRGGRQPARAAARAAGRIMHEAREDAR